VVSENITWFELRKTTRNEILDKTLREMESKVKEYCSKAELAYHDTSGNRWIFLVLNGNPCENELRQMQRAYKEVFDPAFVRWREEYEKWISFL
jgi:hypothetical protein